MAIRYVVRGRAADVRTWRVERAIPLREVAEATSIRSLRGLTIPRDVEVITLPSWANVPARVREAIEMDLRVAQHTSA